jgi:hypothetical protein
LFGRDIVVVETLFVWCVTSGFSFTSTVKVAESGGLEGSRLIILSLTHPRGLTNLSLVWNSLSLLAVDARRCCRVRPKRITMGTLFAFARASRRAILKRVTTLHDGNVVNVDNRILLVGLLHRRYESPKEALLLLLLL